MPGIDPGVLGMHCSTEKTRVRVAATQALGRRKASPVMSGSGGYHLEGDNG